MRVGYNPQKNQPIKGLKYNHQVVIPVYIPNCEDYFKDSFKILKCTLESLYKTCNKKTFITVVNNGSSKEVSLFLDKEYSEGKINEVIHTSNIGKVNAVLKGIVGHNFEFVTIADADVLFDSNWQQATYEVFQNFPKTGVVGLTPQFKMFTANAGNVLFDNFFSKRMRFTQVLNPTAMEQFYESIGWDKNYNKDYLKYHLTLSKKKFTAVVGAGHYAATYRGSCFANVKRNVNLKLGCVSVGYLDNLPLLQGLWRLTTADNYAFHMGNVYEDWMQNRINQLMNSETKNNEIEYFKTSPNSSNGLHILKNKVFQKLMQYKWVKKKFLIFKRLPSNMAEHY